MLVLMFLFPIIIWVTLKRNYHRLKTKECEESIGNMYAELYIGERNLSAWTISTVFYWPVFLIRRFIFVAVPVIFNDRPIYQMISLLLLTNSYQIFYFMMRPHYIPRRRYIEMFNESLIMI